MLLQITGESVFDNVSSILMTGGSIVGIIGAARIYYKWTNGQGNIENEIMIWGGGILFLIISGLVVRLIFGY
jgi:uncharacterized protein DUF4134